MTQSDFNLYCEEVDAKQSVNEEISLQPITDYIKEVDSFYCIHPTDNTSIFHIELEEIKTNINLFTSEDIASLYIKNNKIKNCEVVKISNIIYHLARYKTSQITFYNNFSKITILYEDLINGIKDNSEFLMMVSALFTNEYKDQDLTPIYKKLAKGVFYFNPNYFLTLKDEVEKYLLIFTDEYEYMFLNTKENFQKITTRDLVKTLQKTNYEGFIINVNSSKFRVTKDKYNLILAESMYDDNIEKMFDNILSFDENLLYEYKIEFILKAWYYALEQEEYKEKSGKIAQIIKECLFNIKNTFVLFDSKNLKFYTYVEDKHDYTVLPIYTNPELAFNYMENNKITGYTVLKVEMFMLFNIMSNLLKIGVNRIGLNAGFNGMYFDMYNFMYHNSALFLKHHPFLYFTMPSEIYQECCFELKEFNTKTLKDVVLMESFDKVIYLLKKNNEYNKTKNGIIKFYTNKTHFKYLTDKDYQVEEYTPSQFIQFIKNRTDLSYVYGSENANITYTTDSIISCYLQKLYIDEDTKSFNNFDANDYHNALIDLNNEHIKIKLKENFYKTLNKIYLLYDEVSNELVINKTSENKTYLTAFLEDVKQVNNYTLREYSLNEFFELIENTITDRIYIYKNNKTDNKIYNLPAFIKILREKNKNL